MPDDDNETLALDTVVLTAAFFIISSILASSCNIWFNFWIFKGTDCFYGLPGQWLKQTWFSGVPTGLSWNARWFTLDLTIWLVIGFMIAYWSGGKKGMQLLSIILMVILILTLSIFGLSIPF